MSLSIYSQGEDRITDEIAMKKIGNATQSLSCPKYASCSLSYLTLNPVGFMLEMQGEEGL